MHGAFVRDVVDRHVSWAARHPNRRVELHCADTPDHPLWAELGLPLHGQDGSDLGARMEAAFREALSRAQKVVILGTDSPTLDPAAVDAAFAALEDVPVALGPADDGGYHLLGLRGQVPPIFRGPVWGGDRVLRDTVDSLDRLHIRYRSMKPCFDVDRPEDLPRLAGEIARLARTSGPVPVRTAACLRAWGFDAGPIPGEEDNRDGGGFETAGGGGDGPLSRG